MKWETINSAVGKEVALPDTAVKVSRSLPSRWILHHKKNQKVFVSINDILEYISQIAHVFHPSMPVSFQDTNLKGTVAKGSGW